MFLKNAVVGKLTTISGSCHCRLLQSKPRLRDGRGLELKDAGRFLLPEGGLINTGDDDFLLRDVGEGDF